MFSRMSTLCSSQPTNGHGTIGRMGDTTFSGRLDLALARQGLDNKSFASLLGPTGQQVVNRWRARGRIGGQSLLRVRKILSATSMEWLNDSYGPMAPSAKPTAELLPPSQLAHLDRDRMQEAVRLLRKIAVLQAAPLSLADDPIAICAAYDFLSAYTVDDSGESENVLDLMQRLATKLRGERDAAKDDGSPDGQASGGDITPIGRPARAKRA
jgi:hypothetical protein